MAFLSLLDDRAKPKGSRDPLGFELVWTRFGRTIVGNLTTITSSLENFSTAILGFYWANKLNQHLDDKVRHKAIRETFLRFEQVAAYLRYVEKSQDIMGITRVKDRMLDEGFQLSLGLSQKQMILSDQASYGLWGFYSTAMRDSNLIVGNDRVPTGDGELIAEEIINELSEISDDFFNLIQSDAKLDRTSLANWAPTFMKAINNHSVNEKLLVHLMGGSRTAHLQHELWSITKIIFKGKSNPPDNVPSYIEALFKKNPSNELISALEKIRTIERVLVTINNVFHYCRRKDGVLLSDILNTLKGRYNYNYLPDELPVDNFPWKTEINEILIALKGNNNKIAIELMLSLNKKVMSLRNGAPWLEIEPNKILRVKMKSEKAELKPQDVLESKWDYDYFLESYLTISSKQLGMHRG